MLLCGKFFLYDHRFDVFRYHLETWMLKRRYQKAEQSQKVVQGINYVRLLSCTVELVVDLRRNKVLVT